MVAAERHGGASSSENEISRSRLAGVAAGVVVKGRAQTLAKMNKVGPPTPPSSVRQHFYQNHSHAPLSHSSTLFDSIERRQNAISLAAPAVFSHWTRNSEAYFNLA
ncbi:DNA-binding storekeeper protein-relatedtranscriptional regulator [Striga asiatica]|uniref:DNA-binding storekeeper protein-relatedtranscriptional regulator n=1 Tax=Striga asiatica TaxID=4170 RepID=A0A5A7P4C7_STRAF|nr:DNA-binding storekeeper protein-relatedtranscriptional regulator [Striga asiatica]